MMKLKEMARKAIEEARGNMSQAVKHFEKHDTDLFLESGHAINFYKDGIHTMLYRCGKCGTTSEMPYDAYRRATCPHCGHAESISYNSFTASHRCITAIKYNNEGFSIVTFTVCTEVRIKGEGEGEEKERLDNPKTEAEVASEKIILVYSKKYGAAIYRENTVLSSRFRELPIYLGEPEYFDGDDISEYGISIKHDRISEIWEKIKDLHYEDEAASTAKKAAAEERKEKEIDEIKSYRRDVTEEAAKIAKGATLAFRHPYGKGSNGKMRYVYGCEKCGGVFLENDDDSLEENSDIYCKHCGEKLKTGYYFTDPFEASFPITKHIIMTDWSVDKNKNLILTQYDVTARSVNKEKWLEQERCQFELDGTPSVRLQVQFVNKPVQKPAKVVEGSIPTNDWESIESDNVLTPLADVINESSFQHCNVEIIEKITTKKRNDLKETVGYLQKVAQYPFLASLVSRGLYEAVDPAYRSVKGVIPKGTKDVREALGFSKTVLKLATRYQLSWSEMQTLHQMMRADSALSYECFDWFKTNLRFDECNTITNIVEMINSHIVKPVHMEDIRKYLTSLYYDQCIDYTGGLQTWKDYLSAMNKLNFKPSAYKQKLFPQSLKKEHDILMFAIRNIQEEEKAEAFKDTIEGGRRFEYSFGDLEVKMPQSVEEIVEEGVQLHHSVAQHIERVANKEEYIAFIREKESPDTPFYTVEILREGRGKIVQVRSFSNLPADDRVKAFLNKWASYKKLTIESL